MNAIQPDLIRPIRELDLAGAGIHMYNSSWRSASALVGPTQLCVVDPPWAFSQKFGKGTPYAGMKTSEVCAAVDEMASWITGPCRLLLWTSWAIVPELWGWSPKGFKLKTGGAWSKSGPDDTGHYGQGYHWSGCSEPVLLFVKGAPPNTREKLRNAWIEPPVEHSRKPRRWAEQWVTRWTEPGALVWEPFMGYSQLARPCLLHKRQYIGTEIDPDTFRQAQLTILEE